MEETKGSQGEWGKAFEWAIKGAPLEQVWLVTSDFVGVDKWMTSLVQSCELVEGERNTPDCVRRPVLYPSAAGEPFTYALEKLLETDASHHRYSYTILEGTLPGFSVMENYVSTFKLSPLHHHDEEAGTLLQWSFVCHPVAALTEKQAQHIAFSLYQTAIADLKTRLCLPDDAATLLSSSPS
ncbi:hypothetical protein L7F22_047226 [Adiantum nelumboides]|nr:hypothetical protein [Adiantum nelumboides]